MKFIHLFFMGAVLLLASCSPQKKLHNRLVGRWNVNNYQDQGQESKTNVDNAGSVEFTNDNRGTKDIAFRAMQNYRDITPFSWSNTGNTVTIHGDQSEFAKAWIVVTNKKKKQVWNSTNGRGGVQKITLTR